MQYSDQCAENNQNSPCHLYNDGFNTFSLCNSNDQFCGPLGGGTNEVYIKYRLLTFNSETSQSLSATFPSNLTCDNCGTLLKPSHTGLYDYGNRSLTAENIAENDIYLGYLAFNYSTTNNTIIKNTPLRLKGKTSETPPQAGSNLPAHYLITMDAITAQGQLYSCLASDGNNDLSADTSGK